MDLKEQIAELVDRIRKDPKLLARFQTEPTKAVESLLGVDLPDDAIEKVVAGIKEKLSGEAVSGALDLLKKLKS